MLLISSVAGGAGAFVGGLQGIRATTGKRLGKRVGNEKCEIRQS